MSFVMDATVCKNKIIIKTIFLRIAGAEEASNTGVRGFKVHLFNPIWLTIFTLILAALRLVYTCDKHMYEVTYAGAVN